MRKICRGVWVALLLTCGAALANDDLPWGMVEHAKADKEKCYGLKTPEKDNCAERREGFVCKDPNDERYKHFQYVDKGTCEQLGGRLVKNVKKK
jgi:uncharacterized membrane protein